MKATLSSSFIIFLCLWFASFGLSHSADNLIYNGDFSLGNVGFSTDYKYSTGIPFGQGYYTIGTNPQLVHPGFAPCKDHTQDDVKLMMFFDSYTVANKLVWSQEVDVSINSEYKFSMWATKLVYYDDSNFQIKINGKALTPDFHIGKASCTWSYYESKWNSTSDTKALIEIYNLSTFSAGNDIAIDDLNFEWVSSSCVKPLNVAENISMCIGDTVVLGNENGKRPELRFIWKPNLYLDNPYIGNPKCDARENIRYYIQVVNLDDGCLSYDTIDVIVVIPEFLEIFASSEYLCDESVTLTATEGFHNLKWSNGDSSSTIEITEPGVYTLSAIDKNGCIAVAMIAISGYLVDLQIPEFINFQDICIGGEVEHNFDIFNNSKDVVRISNVEIIGDTENFVFNKNTIVGKEIQPYESQNLMIIAQPKQKGTYYAKFIITFDSPCLQTYEIVLSINAYEPSIHISVPDTLVQIGDQLCIPITGNLSCQSPGLPISYRLVLSINKTLFNPDHTLSGNIISINEIGDNYVIEIEDFDVLLYNAPSVINHLCGLVLLGSKTFDLIEIIEFEPYSGNEYTTKSGSITTEICAHQIRPIQMYIPTYLTINENPTTSSINLQIGSSEEGEFGLEILDLVGISVYKHQWTKHNREHIETETMIDCSNLNQGLYIIKLKTPWNLITEKLIIVN